MIIHHMAIQGAGTELTTLWANTDRPLVYAFSERLQHTLHVVLAFKHGCKQN